MQHQHTNRLKALAYTAVLSGLVVWGSTVPAFAQPASEQQYIDALTPQPKGLERAGSPDDQVFVEQMRGLTRSLTITERERIAVIAAERPSIDAEVFFDFDSAEIKPSSTSELQSLGRALASPAHAGAVVLINGHTDAKGSDAYNQKLSERRAEAIKHYFVQNFGLLAGNLISAGYGREQLKNKANPSAPENRRVQIVNMRTAAEAKK